MSLLRVGVALLLFSEAPSIPHPASERDIVEATTAMAIRRIRGLTSGAFRCDPDMGAACWTQVSEKDNAAAPIGVKPYYLTK
ncbi:hypothetical protein Saso_40100 [Streptomyces asoensis]|uniref:Uncharacterized protein n=1 Tax=Streptomyces asoensis TaxID=249586 RepID=A0ABQ3S2K3_9ACTN|nr:hypothetical protein GCM10010496_63470 [Streptomyces asoensis]GHI62360.1 hypothetical protein Saso_40100 [Streptomyces asoensis]